MIVTVIATIAVKFTVRLVNVKEPDKSPPNVIVGDTVVFTKALPLYL